MKAKNIKEAWKMADEIFPTDYLKDDRRSASAGYDIYFTTASGKNAWISDLGDRLELNLEDGRTINIWIEEEPQFAEYQLSDALRVISDALYHIDDDILPILQKATGIDKARNELYDAYGKIYEIIKSQHPSSKLIKVYNLDEA